MDALDFYGKIKEYCKENKIYLCLGENEFANFLSDRKIYNAYDLIMCADLRLSPSYGDSGIENVVYSGIISLGRKKEEMTQATMDEFFQQKYERRLKELTELLIAVFDEFVCSEEMEMLRCDISYRINSYDSNIDFVSANLSIRVPYNE